MPPIGRVAQWKSTRLTTEGSQVRTLPCPPRNEPAGPSPSLQSLPGTPAARGASESMRRQGGGKQGGPCSSRVPHRIRGFARIERPDAVCSLLRSVLYSVRIGRGRHRQLRHRRVTPRHPTSATPAWCSPPRRLSGYPRRLTGARGGYRSSTMPSAAISAPASSTARRCAESASSTGLVLFKWV